MAGLSSQEAVEDKEEKSIGSNLGGNRRRMHGQIMIGQNRGTLRSRNSGVELAYEIGARRFVDRQANMREDGADIRDIREMCMYRDGLPRNCPSVLEEGGEE